MSDEPKTYKIAKIEDLFNVPAHRRALMLHELGQWMEIHDRVAEMMMIGVLPDGVTFSAPRGTFDWIDDDKGMVHFNVSASAPLGQEPTA